MDRNRWMISPEYAVGGRIVSVSPTYKPQTLDNMERVASSLDACCGSRHLWRSAVGYKFKLGKACLQFFSGDKRARVVGATANLLLSVDEAQLIDPAKFDKDFDPMSASMNCTRVFWGTAWIADTLLERQRRFALRLQEQDGIQRVFFYTADDVRLVNKRYGQHVDRVISERGRNHPLVRTQYFCETIDAQSGMFTPARIALMFPSHFESNSASSPPKCLAFGGTPEPVAQLTGIGRGAVNETQESSTPIAFLIDVAGMDESKTSLATSLADEGLGNPGRDSTTLTIVAVDLSTLETLRHPTYRVLARHSWTGQNHLAVFGQIKNLAEQYSPQQIVIDATGVGEGLWSLLDRFFPTRVTPVKFTAQEKSEIGWGFLSIIETGRFIDPAPSDEVRLQYSFCNSDILPGPMKTLRWGVPDGTRGPDGELIHDDFVLADSLVARLDRMTWSTGTPPVYIEGFDPLDRVDSNNDSNIFYINRY